MVLRSFIFGLSNPFESGRQSDGLVEEKVRPKSGDEKSKQKFENAIKSSTSRILDIQLEKGIPGITVRVSRRGKTIWKSAFGFCDVENQVYCENGAIMRIASISKSIFAATMVAPKLENKSIQLESSVYQYLSEDEFPRKTYEGEEAKITVCQLLSHTSGIRSYEGKDHAKPYPRPIGSKGSKNIVQDDHQYEQKEFYQRNLYRSTIDALAPFKHSPLDGKPGVYHYTTYGYTLLSAVIEKLHNSSNVDGDTKADGVEQVEDVWMKTLSSAWDLKNTKLDHPEVIMPRRARYYMRAGLDGGLINAPSTDNSVKWAGGGLVSNTRDLIKFGNKLLDCYNDRNDRILKPETIEMMWTPVDKNYGLGFALGQDNTKARETVYHTGAAVGASSVLLLRPHSETIVAILSNLQGVNLRPIAMHIAKSFEKIELDSGD